MALKKIRFDFSLDCLNLEISKIEKIKNSKISEGIFEQNELNSKSSKQTKKKFQNKKFLK